MGKYQFHSTADTTIVDARPRVPVNTAFRAISKEIKSNGEHVFVFETDHIGECYDRLTCSVSPIKDIYNTAELRNIANKLPQTSGLKVTISLRKVGAVYDSGETGEIAYQDAQDVYTVPYWGSQSFCIPSKCKWFSEQDMSDFILEVIGAAYQVCAPGTTGPLPASSTVAYELFKTLQLDEF